MRISELQAQFNIGRIFNDNHANSIKNSIKNFKNGIIFKGQEDVVTLSPLDVPEKRVQRIEKIASKANEKVDSIFDELADLEEQSREIKRKGKAELSKVEKKKFIIQGLIERGQEEGFQSFKYDSNRVEFRSTDGISQYILALDEYDDASNKLIRSTTFDTISLRPRAIEEYTKKDGINRYEFSSDNGAVIKISRAVNENSNGTVTKKEYSYGLDGSLKRFIRNHRIDKKGNTSKDEHWYFSNNNLSWFSKKQIDNKDGSSEVKKEFNFIGENLRTYKENIKFDKDRNQLSGETYTFEDGTLKHYSKPQGSTDDTKGKIEHFDFEEGKLWRYYNNQEVIQF